MGPMYRRRGRLHSLPELFASGGAISYFDATCVLRSRGVPPGPGTPEQGAGADSGGSAEARELASAVSESWIQFARTGNPNHRGIPDWPAFSADKCQTMLLDRPCKMKENPDTHQRQAIIQATS